MFCEQPGGVDSFFPRVCSYVNQALARPPPRLCAGICAYLFSNSSMCSSSIYLLLYVCVCIDACVLLCMYTTIMYVCVLYTTVCMYVLLCMCVVHSVCAPSPLTPPAHLVCMSMSVFVQCARVVRIVGVMGSLCRTYVVCGVVCIYCVSWMYVL